jgi:hypothetical protein
MSPLSAEQRVTICERIEAEGGYLELMPITAEVDRSDPGDPVIRLESGCNEFWLNAEQGRAVLEYLQRMVPRLEAVHD